MSNEDEPTRLFQLTLYEGGEVRFTGTKPDDLGLLLRTIAEAADAGKIAWVPGQGEPPTDLLGGVRNQEG